MYSWFDLIDVLILIFRPKSIFLKLSELTNDFFFFSLEKNKFEFRGGKFNFFDLWNLSPLYETF